MPWQNLQKLLRAVSLLSGKSGARIQDFQRELQLSRRSAYRLIDTRLWMQLDFHLPVLAMRLVGSEDQLHRPQAIDFIGIDGFHPG